MEQLLCHLWGDFVFQSSWLSKKNQMTPTGWLACLIHCLIYTAVFCLLTSSWVALLVIFSTHFIIDKFSLALWFIKLRNWNWSKTGYPDAVPVFIYAWLNIIVDNSFHLTINYCSLCWL